MPKTRQRLRLLDLDIEFRNDTNKITGVYSACRDDLLDQNTGHEKRLAEAIDERDVYSVANTAFTREHHAGLLSETFKQSLKLADLSQQVPELACFV